MYSTKAFETGYNEVYVSLFDSVDGSPLNAGHFDIMPMMNIERWYTAVRLKILKTTTTVGYLNQLLFFYARNFFNKWSLNLMFHNHKNGWKEKELLG